MIPQERQNHKNVFFLKTILFLIKSVNIRKLIINYVVPEYRVQFGVNFAKFGFAIFCGKQTNVSEIFNQFFNLLKRGGKFQKTGDGTMFYFRF